MRTDDDPLEAERRQILEIIRKLQDDHQRHLKPYLDMLVRIESIRSPRMYVTQEQAQAMGLVTRARG